MHRRCLSKRNETTKYENQLFCHTQFYSQSFFKFECSIHFFCLLILRRNASLKSNSITSFSLLILFYDFYSKKWPVLFLTSITVCTYNTQRKVVEICVTMVFFYFIKMNRNWRNIFDLRFLNFVLFLRKRKSIEPKIYFLCLSLTCLIGFTNQMDSPTSFFGGVEYVTGSSEINATMDDHISLPIKSNRNIFEM